VNPLNDEHKILIKIVDEIIADLDNAITGSGDNLMQNALKEAKEFNKKESSVNESELQDLLKAHGLSGTQLTLKLSIYDKLKDHKMGAVFSEIWFDFVNSLLGSIPDKVIPGIVGL